MRALLLALLLTLPAAARANEFLSDVTGNWVAPLNAGLFYRAVLSSDGSMLRLRIWQGTSLADLGSRPHLDNRAIARRSPADNGKDWLTVTEDGALQLNTVWLEGATYLHAARLTLSLENSQITVVKYETILDPIRSAVIPREPFSCSTKECISCVADLREGEVRINRALTEAPRPAFSAADAALWTPDRAQELGLCPAPEEAAPG